MFKTLEEINTKPEPFEYYSTKELWTDQYTSEKMLEFHLNDNIDAASRNKAFIERSASWIASRFGINDKFNICDFGCGPGLYTTLLAEKGAKITGIDFSTRSINYAKNTAKEKHLEIDYEVRDYLSYKTDKRFDLITMIMCDYCALSPQQRGVLLQIFCKILKPGGSILLDTYTLEAFNRRAEQSIYEVNMLEGFWSSEKYYGFLNVFKYEQQKVILDKYTIVEKGKTRVIYNWLQCFSKESLKEELEKNSFIIQHFYSDVAGSEFDLSGEEMAIVAVKAG
jgi:2-polyprenyl-3-methyl-5-hydroxy-6-metoxy-1,4-benzoquinol methylase